MASTFKLFADKMGGRSASTYIGSAGELFYNPEIGSIKLSNGTTPGGITVTEPTSVNVADNQWYVDPSRTDIVAGTSTGSPSNPFLSITEALSYIEALITANNLTININDAIVDNPQFIQLMSSTTENVTLTRGNIFITSVTPDAGHVPIWIKGYVNVIPADSSANAINVNRFGLFNVAVIPSTANHAIEISGANPAKLYIKDVYAYQNNATKSCVYANNTGTGSRVEIGDCTFGRAGGSVYLIDIQRGFCSINNLETNGIGQVLNMANDSTGNMLRSGVEANTGAVVTLSGSAQWGMGVSIITNTGTGANTYGISMSGTATMQFGVCTFNVPAAQATNRAINGVAGNVVLYSGPIFQYGTTDKISTVITLIPLDTTFTAA